MFSGTNGHSEVDQIVDYQLSDHAISEAYELTKYSLSFGFSSFYQLKWY